MENKKNKAKSKGRKAKSQGQLWHYLGAKKLSGLLKGITLKT